MQVRLTVPMRSANGPRVPASLADRNEPASARRRSSALMPIGGRDAVGGKDRIEVVVATDDSLARCAGAAPEKPPHTTSPRTSEDLDFVV